MVNKIIKAAESAGWNAVCYDGQAVLSVTSPMGCRLSVQGAPYVIKQTTKELLDNFDPNRHVEEELAKNKAVDTVEIYADGVWLKSILEALYDKILEATEGMPDIGNGIRPTNRYAEVRNDYMFGPGIEPAIADAYDAGLFAGVAIDAYLTDDGDEQGRVIAQVIMSAHGDLITIWWDNGARLDPIVLEAIKEAQNTLREAWKESGEQDIKIQKAPAEAGFEAPVAGTVRVTETNVDGCGGNAFVYVRFNKTDYDTLNTFRGVLIQTKAKLRGQKLSTEEIVDAALSEFNSTEAWGEIVPDPDEMEITF